ncbi:MAG TPA: DUF4349 domain-containing protein [Gemmatimonadales bacterium]|nr:DUF4349 domain-containing protein [Gemmatimonadales bacterium]
MRPIAKLLFTAALTVAACRAIPQPETQERVDARDYSGTGAQGEVNLAAATSVPMVARQRALAAGDAPLFLHSSVAAGMVIRTGQTSIEVDSLEHAVAQVRLLAGRIGGYVANTTMQTGQGQLRSASLEVKIPADRFDDGLGGLAGLGKLESVNVNAEDVGEEFTDVTARMGNARRLEARLIELLATRTGKLKDVLDVEKELARVREEIDRYEGRLRYLRAHAVLSTLTIYVHEPLPVVGHAGSSVIGEAFKQAWRNFVALVAACIRGLGIVIPLGILLTAAWLSVKRLSLLAPRSAGR